MIPSAPKTRRPLIEVNMTPIIDIVFLLIIFFMLVCQFIVAENFEVQVPDRITSAQGDPSDPQTTVTVTVMLDDAGRTGYAVGSEIVRTQDTELLTELMTQEVDNQLRALTPEQRLVTLRIDRDIPFSQAKYALAAVSNSAAPNIKLSVIKDHQPE